MKSPVSIPNPCSENFSAMPRCGKNLYCQVCQKQIVDLRNKNLDEIHTELEKYINPCIVVDAHQVKEKKNWKWADRSAGWLRKYRLSGMAAVLLGICLFLSSCHPRRHRAIGGYFKNDPGKRTEVQQETEKP